MYGVDLNEIAVELARLSLWIHTFVPGLPLSFLDHNLVVGNSLTGIGTIDEAGDYLAAQAGGSRAKHGQSSVFETQIADWLERAKEPLIRLGRASDATSTELKEVRTAAEEARQRADPVRKLFDLVCAMRRGEAEPLMMGLSTSEVERHDGLQAAERAAAELASLHFPVAFPEVFLRERSGFDCLIGNPPWEKAVVKADSFWAVRFPGLNAASVTRQNALIGQYRQEYPELDAEYRREIDRVERIKQALISGGYPEISRGDVDLYKAFAWRFVRLCAAGGRIGVVMPRSLLSAAGSAEWREEVLTDFTFEDVTILLNNRAWVFPEVHAQFAIALVVLAHARQLSPTVAFRGPYASYSDYRRGIEQAPVQFDAAEFKSWSSGAVFPLLPTEKSVGVFLRMRRHPRIDSAEHPWRFRPLRELHSTDDKPHMVLDPESTDGLWPVYKGETIDLWTPDRGIYYAWVEPSHIVSYLQDKRVRQQRNRRSAFSELDEATARNPDSLPCLHPRIVFRKVTNRTNTRTLICALVPPKVTLNDGAQYLLRIRGTVEDEAYILGMLSSLIFDWYPRRIVEINMSFHFFDAFPIPNPPRTDPLRRRVVAVAGALAAQDDRFGSWAREIGVEITSPEEAGRAAATAELDALAAALFGLSRDDVVHIFETFHSGWDYRDRLDQTLSYFEAL